MIVLGDEYVDAYVGYRQWGYVAARGTVKLTSLTQLRGHRIGKPDATVWLPGVKEAECLCRNHIVAPRCGLYAWRSQPRSVFLRPRYLWGEVAMWGDIDIHEKAYRSEFAKPIAFYVFPQMTETHRCISELAAAQYDVPLIDPGIRVADSAPRQTYPWPPPRRRLRRTSFT